jgi:tRNA threonylcarbamoyladenosine biosynthesis protein TsaE
VSTGPAQRIHSTGPEQTLAFGERIGARLCTGAPEGIVVLLVGPLGAGKTVLAKGIARGLGITEQVVSPTYTIVSEYASGRRPVHHVDLYRIEGSEQMENLGLEDIMAGNGIVLIEWGEKLAAGLANGPAARLTITLAADGGRDIVAEGLPL